MSVLRLETWREPGVVVQDEHPNRMRILDALEETPGLTFRGIMHGLGIAAGTLRHHLHVLERQERVWRLEVGQCHHHFMGSVPDAVDLELLEQSALVDELDRRILREAWQARLQRQILDALEGETPRSTVQHRLQRLVRLGLLVKVQGRRRVFYRRASA